MDFWINMATKGRPKIRKFEENQTVRCVKTKPIQWENDVLVPACTRLIRGNVYKVANNMAFKTRRSYILVQNVRGRPMKKLVLSHPNHFVSTKVGRPSLSE